MFFEGFVVFCFGMGLEARRNGRQSAGKWGGEIVCASSAGLALCSRLLHVGSVICAHPGSSTMQVSQIIAAAVMQLKNRRWHLGIVVFFKCKIR